MNGFADHLLTGRTPGLKLLVFYHFGLYSSLIDFRELKTYTGRSSACKSQNFFMTKNWKNQITEWATGVLRRRRSPLLLKQLAWYGAWLAARCGASNPVSFILRPVVGHKRLRKGVGLTIAGLVIVAAIWGPYPLLAGENTGGQMDIVVRSEGEVNLTTKQGVVLPLEQFTISQGFWLLHPGIDMATELGAPVKPVMAGKVIHAEAGWLGYGNRVVIDHGSGYSSLYAHLSKIEAWQGQEVGVDTEIGKVGSTGHSTGPHLHLEIYQDGRPVNPLTVLDIK